MICFLMIYASKMQNPILMCQEFYIRIETKKLITFKNRTLCLSGLQFCLPIKGKIYRLKTAHHWSNHQLHTFWEHTQQNLFLLVLTIVTGQFEVWKLFLHGNQCTVKKRQPQVTEKFQLKLLVFLRFDIQSRFMFMHQKL